MNYNLIPNRRLPMGQSQGDGTQGAGINNEMLQKVIKDPSGGTAGASGSSSVNPAVLKALFGMLSGGMAL